MEGGLCGMPNSAATEDAMFPTPLQDVQQCNAALKSQIEFYKQEQSSLRADMTALVEENQQLAAQLKVALGASLGQEPPGECRRRTADLVANLQRQLLLTSQEKAAATELYQKALKEMQSLEAELAGLRDGGHIAEAEQKIKDLKKQNCSALRILEDKLEKTARELERERDRVAKLEEELCCLRLDRDRLKATLESCECHMEDALQAQQAAANQVEAVQNQCQSLQNELDKLRRERDELEAALLDTTQRAEELARREWAAISRVEEALTLVDAAVLEKDASLAAEARAQEEVSRLQRSLDQLMEEAGKQLTEETTRIKQQCNCQLEIVLKDIQALQEDVNRKKSQLDKANKDVERLEQELDNMRRQQASLPDPVAVQHSLDNAYRELRRSEMNSMELQNDRDKLLQRLDETEKKHCTELCGAREEALRLRQELQAVRAQADQAEATGQARAVLLEDQIAKLEQQLNALQCAGQPAIPQDDTSHEQCEQQLEEYRRIVSQLSDMQQRGMRVAQELQSHLDAQVEAKLRWQNEVKTLSSRFEQRIESLRGQLGGLKRANRNLERKLAATQSLGDSNQPDVPPDCACQW